MHETKQGILFGILAFAWWGLSPIYFHALEAVPPLEIIAHRVIWSAISLGLGFLLVKRNELKVVFEAIKSHWPTLLLASVLLTANWLIYVYAVTSAHVLEASLGYFINPLVNVALGYFILKERLSRVKQVAVGLACFAVLLEIVRFGQLPWIALSLAGTFGCYGLIRKRANIGGALGLFIETLFMLPLAMVYLTYLLATGDSAFLSGRASMDILLVLAGLVTTLPLIWFIAAAKRLNYSTVGLLQYIGPTLMGCLGYFVWNESLPPGRGLTFACVWLGLAAIAMVEIKKRPTT